LLLLLLVLSIALRRVRVLYLLLGVPKVLSPFLSAGFMALSPPDFRIPPFFLSTFVGRNFLRLSLSLLFPVLL
jgi:hypothetical protein